MKYTTTVLKLTLFALLVIVMTIPTSFADENPTLSNYHNQFSSNSILVYGADDLPSYYSYCLEKIKVMWPNNIVKTDKEVTSEDKSKNMILLGGPLANRIVFELATAKKTPDASYWINNLKSQYIVQGINHAFTDSMEVLIIAGYDDTQSTNACNHFLSDNPPTIVSWTPPETTPIPPVCVRSFPSVIITPSSQVADSEKGGKYAYDVEIVNGDNSACGPSIFSQWLIYNSPISADNEFGENLPPINPGDSLKYKIYAHVPPNTQPASYSVGVGVKNSNAPTYTSKYAAELYVVLKPSQVCTDSDDGMNYYQKGILTVTHNNGVKEIFEDECNGEKINEYVCNSDGGYSISTSFECPNGCNDGACTVKEVVIKPPVITENAKPAPVVIPQNDEINKVHYICDGCPVENNCYPIGYRMSGEYCGPGKIFISQLNADTSCDNNFECGSNICASGNCISGDLLQRILNWFKKIFGM